jgi:glycosyltransferase involved in cell wall biosynthesis
VSEDALSSTSQGGDGFGNRKDRGVVTVSVLICTRDRVGSLRETLESISRARVPRGWSIETVVVDNGSTDGTRDLVESFRFPWGKARFELELQKGVASARSRALKVARGEVLLWTDDDVRVPQDWIEKMASPILEGTSEVLAGGVVLAPGRERSWMGPCMRAWLASSESLNPEGPGRMIGANMAFHRSVLSVVSCFDPELGPGALGMGEETLFSYQLTERGIRIDAAFGVQVQHAFDVSRLSAAAFFQIARSMGKSEAYLAYHWHGVDVSLANWKVLDAYARWCVWKIRGWMRRATVPAGLLEGELQARARIAYWLHLRCLRGSRRKYFPRGIQRRMGAGVEMAGVSD